MRRYRQMFDFLFRPHFYCGSKAEEIFEELCADEKLICQRLDQDKRSFRRQVEAGHPGAKRPDFIIRNRENAEVEVKAYSPRMYRGRLSYFLAWQHVARHREGVKVTGARLYIAFFARSGRAVDRISLRMIRLDDLAIVRQRPKGVIYSKWHKGLWIPVDCLQRGFAAIS